MSPACLFASCNAEVQASQWIPSWLSILRPLEFEVPCSCVKCGQLRIWGSAVDTGLPCLFGGIWSDSGLIPQGATSDLATGEGQLHL